MTNLMFIASMIAGVAVWVLFHALNTEPWDTPFGPPALLGLGFVFGYTGRRHPMLPLTLPALIGALAGAGLAKRSLPAGEQ